MKPKTIHTCPKCRAEFSGPWELHGKTRGKTCPNGHWTSSAMLYYHRKRIDSVPLASPLDPLKDGKGGPLPVADQLALALRLWQDSYERLVSQLPESSAAGRLVAGTFRLNYRLTRQLIP